jgi:hypothetical protein
MRCESGGGCGSGGETCRELVPGLKEGEEEGPEDVVGEGFS